MAFKEKKKKRNERAKKKIRRDPEKLVEEEAFAMKIEKITFTCRPGNCVQATDWDKKESNGKEEVFTRMASLCALKAILQIAPSLSIISKMFPLEINKINLPK